jgi:ATP-dependent metalloprotease
MDACNQHGQSHVAIRRFESGSYASDEAVCREYVRALALTNQLARLPMSQLAPGFGAAGATPSAGGAMTASGGGLGGGGGGGPRGTLDQPIHVQYTESTRAQMLRLLQRLAFFGLAAGALMMLVDEKALPKGLGLGSSDVQPVTGSPKRFADVMGVDEAKQDLLDIVQYLRQPKQFTRLGGKLPKGCLLTGPPGTGKTLLARAVAGEAGVPFFYMSGSEFEEVFVGVGAKRVRELFGAAKKRAPCIIFIDEIDAIGSHRNPKEQQAMKMTLNQLLVEMDGFQQNAGVIVLAATNFPESLDRALVRPGRFDTRVVVPLPDVVGRKQILGLYSKPIVMDDEVDLERIARATPGFSGADLSNLMNVAALKASHDEKKRVGMEDLEYACDKIRMGAERRSAHISEENLKLTAYHEGGHALVAVHTKGAMPIHKATIVPRGEALGMVSYLPEKDQMNMSRQQMLAHIDVCMGGRVAEELIFGQDQVTTGASSDLQQATSMARNMVTKYGMSESLGPMFHSRDELENLSPATREAVEAEVKAYVVRGETNARRILSQHKEQLHRLAQGLLKHETISKDEITEVIAGRPIEKGGGASGGKGVVATAVKGAKGAVAKGVAAAKGVAGKGSAPATARENEGSARSAKA